CLAAYVLGSGLARLSSGARVFAGVLTLIGLGGTVLGVLRGQSGGLIGTGISLAWSAAYVWLFFSSRSRAVTEPAYRLIVAQSPSQRPRMLASPFFWLPLIGIAMIIVMFLVFFGLASFSILTG